MGQAKRSAEQWLGGALDSGPWLAPRKVASGGYEWVDAEGGPWLVDAETRGAFWPPAAARVDVDLPDVPSTTPLHRRLWSIYAKHKGEAPGDQLRSPILEFANTFGMLGLRPQKTPWSEAGAESFGERLANWVDAIGSIGRLTTLWDLIRTRDVAALGRHIVWYRPQPNAPPEAIHWEPRDDWPMSFLSHLRRQIATSEDVVFRQWRQGDVMTPARMVLAEALNRRLSETVSPKIVLSRADGRFEGRLAVARTIGVAHLQLYQEMTGKRRYTECRAPGCGRWLDTTEGRSTRQFCDDACRKRAARELARRASQQAAEL